MVPFHTLTCLLCFGLCPGEPAQQQVELPAARPAKPVISPQTQALLDRGKELDRQFAASQAKSERLDRESKVLWDAYEKRDARLAYERASMLTVELNAALNSVVRAKTGLRLPSVKYWQLVSPRVDDPDLPQAIKDHNYILDFIQFKSILSKIRFEVNVVCWTWTGVWLPEPAFLR